MKRIEKNKLIAEFMDVEEVYNPNGNDWVFKTTEPDINEDTDIIESFKANELQYHNSWEWLIPVVDKCFQEEGKHYVINDALLTINIDEVYDAVVEFIKQHNKQ